MEQSYVIRNDRVIGKTVPNINYNYSTCPIGSIFAFSSERIPLGFLTCDGASYAVAEYPDLYAVIGNTYGGDTENFNVPNLIDKFIQGSATSGTEKEAGLPQVNMTNARNVSAQNKTISAKEGLLQNGQKGYGASGSTSSLNATSMVGLNLSNNDALGVTVEDALIANNPIYGNSDTVQPPALTMVYIIKAFHTNEGVDSGVSDDVVEYVEGEIAKKAAIDDTQASTETTWSSEKISSELGGKVYTSLAELGLTADATFQDVISALPKGSSALLGVTEFTNYQTIFPYEEGNDQFARVYIVKGVADGSRMYARWFRKDGVKEAIAIFNINDNKFNGWRVLRDQRVYTSLKELGLDTTATINDIIGAMKDSSVLCYKTDVFDYATEYNNIQLGTVVIHKQSASRVQALMTDKDTGNLYVGRLDGNNKVIGWRKIITEISDPYSCTKYTGLTGTEDLFTLPCGHYVSANINTTYNYPITDTNTTAHIYVLGHLNDPANNKGYRIILYFDNKGRMYRINEWWGVFTDNGWQEIATKPITELTDLGLDGSATIQNVMDKMSIGQHCIINTSRFDDKTEVDNIEYGKVEIRRLSSGMWSLWLEDVLHGSTVAHGTCANGKFAGWHYFTTKSYVDSKIADLQAQIDALK